MAVHTVAFFSPDLEAASGFRELPAIDDQTVQITQGNRVILSQDMSIVAAYAGANAANTVTTTEALVAARISAPSLRKIISPSIVPTSAFLPAEDDPAMMSVANWPWKVSCQEEISIEVLTEGGPLDVAGLLWFQDVREEVPVGDNYWIRATTDLKVTTEDGWSSAALAYDQTLAAGRYAVIGFVCKSVNAYAARLIFDRQVWRPGTLCIPKSTAVSPGQRTSDIFYNGALGVLGKFHSYSPPRLEVFKKTGGAEAGEIYLRIVRISDQDEPGSIPMSPSRSRG